MTANPESLSEIRRRTRDSQRVNCIACGARCEYRYACRLLDGRNGKPVCYRCHESVPSEPTVRFEVTTLRLALVVDNTPMCDHAKAMVRGCLICLRLNDRRARGK